MSDEPQPYADVFESIGRIAAASAVLESALLDLHEVLLASPRGRTVVVGEPFSSAHRAVLQLANDLDDKALGARVRKASTRANDEWAKRGDVVHGKWHIRDDGNLEPGKSALVSNRKRAGTQLAVWSSAKLSKLNRDLIAATREVQAVTLEVFKVDHGIR